MWWHRTQHNCASDTVSLKGVRGQKVDLLRFPVKKYSPQRTPQSRVATTDIISKSMRGAGTNRTGRLELVCVQGVDSREQSIQWCLPGPPETLACHLGA